ncbi:MAG: hypothetical protein JO036_00875 [Candidatus Eremiobacteraeota bacterium]|nr:hypothetical protein [Candidatus Eremiobacteraeota bacterium]
MAFGIDDALAAAAAGISLTDTVVRTVKAYRKRGIEPDIEGLIEGVRLETLSRLREADRALRDFERMLLDKHVDINKSLLQVIESTPWWRPDEAYRLKRMRSAFTELANATYNASDDIAALLRCRDQTGDMGVAVAQSAREKHDLQEKLLRAKSVKIEIDLLRSRLDSFKSDLMQ